tara:strand:+ start:201 stop:1103 length:903 start_codon:yes stop_codon:yes gene_type:complete
LKVLILGTGYIGSEIAYLLSKNHDVVCIDHGNNFSSLNSIQNKIKLIKDEYQNVNLIQDVTKDIDLICYCINTGGVVDCIQNSELYKKINIDDFKQLLESIHNKKCHFLLLSTAFVYADSKMNLEDSIPEPETLYGKFRLEQEKILVNSKLPYTILRLSNIYGHHNLFQKQLSNVIDKFILNIFQNQEITIFGDGTHLVDFVHIRDFLTLFEKIINKRSKNEIYNIANENRISINDIAKIMINIARDKHNISVILKKQLSDNKLPNIPKISTVKIQEKFSWENKDNIDSIFETIFEKLKK